MNFKDFFNKDTDRDIAGRLKYVTKITMQETERDRMRMHLSEYTKMRPIRTEQPTHVTHLPIFPALLASVRPMPLIAALLIVSIGSSAVSAESALPGDILYPIKVHFIEEVQASLTRNPEAKAQWAVARAQRRLEEAVTLELSGNLTELAGAELDNNFEEHVRLAHESTQTPSVAAEIGAIRVARENILGVARAPKTKAEPPTQPIARAKATLRENPTSLPAETPQAAMMSAEQDFSLTAGAAPEPSTFSIEAVAELSDTAENDNTEIRARGHRTAAKVRIEATKKFLESNKKIAEKSRKEAQERLKIAIETLSSGDTKSSNGDQADAASEFKHALEAATEAGAFLSSKHEDD